MIPTWLRGLAQLRHPETIRLLGEMRTAAVARERILRSIDGAIIHDDVLIQGWAPERMHLERDVRVEKGTVLALGDDFNGYGTLHVGERSWIGQYNNFRLARGADIRIGAGCLISQFCSLIAANHRITRDTKVQDAPCDESRVGIIIGDDVWLGAGVAVMPAVSIATGAVVGANSVVTTSVPEFEIWAGAPARKIGERR